MYDNPYMNFLQSEFPYNWKKLNKRRLSIINLFQLDFTDSRHTMERKIIFLWTHLKKIV